MISLSIRVLLTNLRPWFRTGLILDFLSYHQIHAAAACCSRVRQNYGRAFIIWLWLLRSSLAVAFPPNSASLAMSPLLLQTSRCADTLSFSALCLPTPYLN